MALRITHDMMTLGIDNHVVATARFSEHAVGRRHRRVDRLHAFGPAAHPRPGPGSQPLEPYRLMCALSGVPPARGCPLPAGAGLPGCLGKGHGAALNRASTRR